MGALFFIAGLAVALLLSIFGWTKILMTFQASEKVSKDIWLSIAWAVLFTLLAFVCWFIVPGSFLGYMMGLVLGLSLAFSGQKNPNDTDSNQTQGQ